MSVFSRVAIAALIIFASGSCGLYYIMSEGDGISLDFGNRRLNLNQTEQNQTRQKRFDNLETLEDDEIEEDIEYEDEELEDVPRAEVNEVKEQVKEDVVPDLVVLTHSENFPVSSTPSPTHTLNTHTTEEKTETLGENKEETEEQLEKKYGSVIEKKPTVYSTVPQPLDRNNRPIRVKQYTFDKVKRDPRFEEEKIQKFERLAIAREWRDYLILADKDHELWEIKHKQLMSYLPNIRNQKTGGIRFGWLDLKTTKEQLAEKCHASYSINFRTYKRNSFFSASKDYDAIWDWCTLPEYWGQEKPKNWPQ